MSSYGTEFEHTDRGGDEMYVNRCGNEHYPLMIFMAGGRVGVEMWREDVARFAAYLTGIVDTVPVAPEPEPFVETFEPTHGGHVAWPQPVRRVCHNTLAFANGEPMEPWHGVPYPDISDAPTYRFVVGVSLADPKEDE